MQKCINCSNFLQFSVIFCDHKIFFFNAIHIIKTYGGLKQKRSCNHEELHPDQLNIRFTLYITVYSFFIYYIVQVFSEFSEQSSTL